MDERRRLSKCELESWVEIEEQSIKTSKPRCALFDWNEDRVMERSRGERVCGALVDERV